ncbi:MAG: flagellar motor protein MotB [Phycisphaerales bacterium]
MQTTSTLVRRLSLVAVAAVSCLTLVGCNDKQKAVQADLESARMENQELRSRIDQQQSALDACDNEKRSIQSQMASMQTPAAPVNSGWQGGGGGGGGGSGGTAVLTVAGDTLFAPGSATVKAEARGELNRIARQLNGQYSGHQVRVEGHTDSDPLKKSKDKWGSNENLSRARAQAVADYLSGQGVSSGRMSVVGMGSSQPRGDKKTSRRVEIVVLAN